MPTFKPIQTTWWVKMVMFLILSIITVTNNFQSDQELIRFSRDDAEEYRLNGYPNLPNCESNIENIRQVKMTVDTPYPIFPRWENYTERKVLPISPINDYVWKYKMVKVVIKDGKSIEKPIDISNWLEDHGSTINIPPYGVPPGHYKVYPSVTLKNPEDRLRPFNKTVCHFIYSGLPPVVVISGGSNRIVPTNKEIKLNGEESFDPNDKRSIHENFLYSWKCTQKRQPPTFCTTDILSHKSKIRIPAHFVKAGDTFTVTLTILTTFDSNDTFTQIINVLDDAAQIEITCEKNCSPVSETSNFQHEHYEWTIEREPKNGFTFNYENDTEFGRKGTKFFVHKNVLTPGIYNVIVNLTDSAPRKGEAIFTLNLENPPQVNSCDLIPPSGESLQTHFRIECNQKPGFQVHFYELYSMLKGEDFLKGQVLVDGFYPDVYRKLFLLPSSENRTFMVKISIDDGPYILVPIHPNVKNTFLTKSTKEIIEYFKNVYFDQSPNLIDAINPAKREKGFQTLQSLIDELRSIENDKNEFQTFVEDFKYQVVEDLLKAPFTTSREIMNMLSAVEKLMSYNDQSKSKPLLSKFSSTLCKKLGQKYVDVFRKERFPLIHEEMNSKVARSVSDCLEANTNPNFDILVPLPVNITTAPPSALESVLSENYPDYHDFSDVYYTNIENLQEATSNILEGAAAAAKVTALSTAIGEKPIIQKGKVTDIIVAKDRGDLLATTKLQVNGVVLVPPKNLVDVEHSIDIFVITWKKNFFWWLPNSTKASTNIVNVEFWHSTCKKRLRSFDNPAEIFLNITHQNLKYQPIEDVVVIPENFSRMFHQELNRQIYVCRIDVPFRHTLLVKFHNLSSTVLNVVVTLFKFPTIEDFAPPEVISASGRNFMVAANYYNYDVWGYVGILPKKGSINAVKFAITFFTSCCIRWKPVKNHWGPTCIPGAKTNLTMIHCLCSNFSTIAGYLQNAKSIHQQVFQEEIILVAQANLTIFILLVTVLAIYCILLLLTLGKTEKKAALYFLADNLTKHRHAYLMVIITGKVGTTSHVTVRVTGNQGSTPAHVLNYPDPKMRLLQKKCKDAFVITNKNHLGNIEEVELWVDCFGTKPSWFCEEIEIYDLQWKRSWYFEVNQLLSTENSDIHLTLYPTKRKFKNVAVKVFKKLSVWSNLHTWCFWAHEMNFSYVKRLTVVFSTILMTFVMVFILKGVPEMEARDILDLNQFAFGWYDVFAAVAGSLMSFIIHIFLAWSFRLSTLQFPEVDDYSKLPYSVTKGCWRILIVLIVASTCFLIVWGFWLPYTRSLVWLTACCVGIFFDVIIYENIVIAIVSLFYKYEKIEYCGKDFDTVKAIIEKQRFLLLQHFGGSLLRLQVEHLHKLLPSSQFKERKMKDKIRRNFFEELVDLVMFTIYTFILYVVILVNRDSSAAVNKKELENVLDGKHTRTLGFTSIRSIEEMYRYINETLIPILQPLYWYEGVPISEPGVMVDFTSKYLGVARFRQQRIIADDCIITELAKFLNVTKCWPELTSSNVETRNFGYRWENFSSTLILDRLHSIWYYLGESETETLHSIGQFSVYSGGGYLSYLGRNVRNSLVNFRHLLQRIWIDRQTRSFFIEFLTYNINDNMFNAVRLLFEQSASGYVSNTIEIYPARMIFVQSEMEKIAVVFFGLFVMWATILFIQRSVTMIKNIGNFYKNVWFLVDILIVVMSFICIIVGFIRLTMIHSYLKTLENVRHNEFVPYFALFYIEDFLTVSAAFLVLISTARLWKFLRFGLFFRIMESTLSNGTFPLLSLTFAFMVILMAFGLSGLLIFGNEFPELSSLIKIVATLITLSLKPDQFDITNFIQFSIAYWYFSSYLLLMQIILLIYIIIIIMSYMKARLSFSEEVPTYNFRSFLEEQLWYIPKMFRRKYDHLSGGEDKKKVIPKSDEFLYANCLSTQKSTMEAMACITKCVIRHLSKNNRDADLSNDDVELMLKVCQHLVYKFHQDDEIEIFFKGHFVGERVILIDEKRIMKVADLVELLLREDKEKLKHI